MKTEVIERKFAAMGAKVRFSEVVVRPWNRLGASQGRAGRPPYTVDIRDGTRGQFFEVLFDAADDRPVDMAVLDVQPAERHLLLMASWRGDRGRLNRDRFLCGHDERAWFAATVPGSPNTVFAAKQALKPELVVASQLLRGVKVKALNRRRNPGFVRQGEWFFVPAPDFAVEEWLVLSKEPLRRGRGKPHLAESLFRRGGQTVYVCNLHPSGLTENQYRELVRREPDKKKLPWRTMAREPEVYVKGRISHPDHKTITLSVWHRVLPNTENASRAGSSLAFLD